MQWDCQKDGPNRYEISVLILGINDLRISSSAGQSVSIWTMSSSRWRQRVHFGSAANRLNVCLIFWVIYVPSAFVLWWYLYDCRWPLMPNCPILDALYQLLMRQYSYTSLLILQLVRLWIEVVQKEFRALFTMYFHLGFVGRFSDIWMRSGRLYFNNVSEDLLKKLLWLSRFTAHCLFTSFRSSRVGTVQDGE